MTVQQIFDLIDRFAPFETQSEDDNSGFLVGSASQEVTAALFALDVTEKVIDEAVSLGAQLIVTHHPLTFKDRLEISFEMKLTPISRYGYIFRLSNAEDPDGDPVTTSFRFVGKKPEQNPGVAGQFGFSTSS